jgi:hypothetical protein
MDPNHRQQLEAVTREGLAKLGAPPERIAWALDPAIPDAQLAQRVKEVTDECIRGRLGASGLSPDEVAAVMDEGGTPEEREARRHAALEANLNRQLSDPATLSAILGSMLDDPAVMAKVQAAALAEAQKQRRKRIGRALVAAVLLAASVFVAWRWLRPSPCAELLGTDAELSKVFGTPARRAKIFDTKYFCSVDVEDASTHARLAYVMVESARSWSSSAHDITSETFASVESPGIGDTSKLGIAGPKKAVPTDLGSLQERRRQGSSDPIGDALSAMGPAGHTLVARAGDGMIRVVFYGSEAQAREATAWFGGRLGAVRATSYP